MMLKRIEHDTILELQLDRPPANALNEALLAELRAAIDGAPEAGYEGLVISGRPGMFSGGLDVPEILRLDRAGVTALWSEFFATLRSLAGSSIPLAAAVTGHSPAGGAVLTLFCDYRVMAEGDFQIGLNEVRVGLSLKESIYGPLRRLVGQRQAERLAVEGAMIFAAEARALGWIDELAPVDKVVARAIARLRPLLALPRRAMLSTRALMRQDLIAMLGDDATSVGQVVELWFSDETQKALHALVARLAERNKSR
jgi:enoyl-CoA hydratase/carnithine racemase